MDSGQASLFRDSLQETSIGGWHVSGFYGNGKSAVVLPAVRGIELNDLFALDHRARAGTYLSDSGHCRLGPELAGTGPADGR